MEPKEQVRGQTEARLAQPPMLRVFVLSGVSGCGKSSLCARIAELARERGATVGGVLTHSRFEGGRRVGLDVEDLRTGRRWPLAEGADGTDGPATGGWHFHSEGLEAGVAALCSATPCHLLIVDELGPLELLRDTGWQVGLDVLAGGRYRLALVVVRPALVPRLRERLGVAELPVLVVTLDRREAIAVRILDELGDLG